MKVQVECISCSLKILFIGTKEDILIDYVRTKKTSDHIYWRYPMSEKISLIRLIHQTMISSLYNIYDNVKYITIFSNNTDKVAQLLSLDLGELGILLGKVWKEIGYNSVDNAIINLSYDIKLVLASNIGFMKNSSLKFGTKLNDVTWFDIPKTF